MERAHKYEFEGKVRYSEIDHRASIIFRTAVPFSPSNSDMEWMC